MLPHKHLYVLCAGISLRHLAPSLCLDFPPMCLHCCPFFTEPSAFQKERRKEVHGLCRHSLNVPHLLSAAPFSLGSALGMFWRSWEMGPCRSYRQISSVQRSPFLQRWKTTVSLPGSGGKQSLTFSKVLKKIPRNFHQTSGTVFSLMPVRQNDQVL